ncbi:MAG TPA: hypothetical protein VFG83_00710 [Kofleriaceae bacterium]|nr:hypothetical protein [Kofleriaceae bacterium]
MRTTFFATGLVLALFTVACTDYTAEDPQVDGGNEQAAGPTFYEDVAPLLYDNCVTCHRDGGIAPFSLVTYEDAKSAAPRIAYQVENRLMPPWNVDNSGDCNTFQDARWLEDDEIATIAAWADGDRAEGDPAAAPAVPEPAPGLSQIDAVAEMGESYTPGDLTNDYRCFVVDPGIAADTFLTAFEVVPGEPKIVHHMLLFAVKAADVQAAVDLDAADPGPGYQCFGGPVAPSSLVAVWAPGVTVYDYPEGTGLPIAANSQMILQIHYHPVPGEGLADRTKVNLKLADTVDKPGVMTLVANTGLTLPPHQENVASGTTATLPDWVGPISVWAAFPHMHTLGQTLEVGITHDGRRQCAINVPNWRFEWQQGYNYTEPLLVSGGDEIDITCTYDTRSRETTTTWGEGTEDEMCLSFFYLTAY